MLIQHEALQANAQVSLDGRVAWVDTEVPPSSVVTLKDKTSSANSHMLAIKQAAGKTRGGRRAQREAASQQHLRMLSATLIFWKVLGMCGERDLHVDRTHRQVRNQPRSHMTDHKSFK